MNRTDATSEQIVIDGQEGPIEKQMLDCVLNDLALADQERSKYVDDWDKYQRKYACILDAGKYPWRSKVFDPESYAVIETICPRITNTLLGGAEIFGVKPTGTEDVQKAEMTERLLNYQADRMNLYETGGEGFKTALIEGTGHWKFRWAKEFEPRYSENPTLEPVLDENGEPLDNGEGGIQTKVRVDYQKTWECVYDNPKLDWVDNRDLWVDPFATDPQNARFVIHRVYRTKDYLKKKQLEGVYKNVDDIKALTPVPEAKNDADDKATDRGTITFHETQLDDVEILERWGSYDIDGDGYLEECVITVANRNTILAADYNKLPGAGKPFLKFTPIPVPGRYYGMSALASFDTIQDALNDRTNQIGDAINLTINPMYKKVRWGDINDDDLVSRPGGVVEMNSMSDLEPLMPPVLPPQAFGEIQRFEGIIQKASGTYDVSRGMMPQQETATTTIALQNVAEIRFKTMAIIAERQFIRPLGNLMIRYNRLYMTRPREIRILGNDFMLAPTPAGAMGMPNGPGATPAMGPMQPGNPAPAGASPNANMGISGLFGPMGDQFMKVGRDNLAEDPDIYAVGAALEVGTNKEIQINNLMKFLQITSNPIFMNNPFYSINHAAIVERLPYLMNIKLKQPLVTMGNPMLAYQEVQKEQAMADGMMMQEIQNGMPPGGSMMGQGGPQSGPPLPSRTKGELAKSTVPENEEEGE